MGLKRRKLNRTGLTKDQRDALLDRGIVAVINAGFVFPSGDAGRRQAWKDHRAVLLVEWVRENPGTRPRVWWEVDAPEPRGDESERDYLARLGLLLEGEQ